MIKAYVLVVTDPGETKRVVAAIGKIPGVVELHEVMGPYDIVVEIEVDRRGKYAAVNLTPIS